MSGARTSELKRLSWSVLLTLLLSAGLLCVTAQPAGAYWDDVHYDLTYYLARLVGFTPLQAYRLAAADLSTDYDDATKPDQISPTELALRFTLGTKTPPGPDKQNPGWMFHAFRNQVKYPNCVGNSADSAAAQGEVKDQETALFKQAVARQGSPEAGDNFAPGNAGVFFHFLQDESSHEGFGSMWGHWFDPVDPTGSTIYAYGAKLPVGASTDFLSFHDLADNYALVKSTSEQLRQLLDTVSPRQHAREVSPGDYTVLVERLRAANPAPVPLSQGDLPLYRSYGGAKHGIGTAPVLTAEQQKTFDQHLGEPNLDAAEQAVNNAMKDRGMKEGKLPDYKAAREAFHFHSNGHVNPGLMDKWTLVGVLKVQLELKGGVNPGPVDVVVKAPSTMAGEASYTLTHATCSVGHSVKFEQIPVGDIKVEAQQNGKLVGSTTVTVDEVYNEATLNIQPFDQLDGIKSAIESVGFTDVKVTRSENFSEVKAVNPAGARPDTLPLGGVQLEVSAVPLYSAERASARFDSDSQDLLGGKSFRAANVSTDPDKGQLFNAGDKAVIARYLPSSWNQVGGVQTATGGADAMFICGNVAVYITETEASKQSLQDFQKSQPDQDIFKLIKAENLRLAEAGVTQVKDLCQRLAQALAARGVCAASSGANSGQNTGTPGTGTPGTGTPGTGTPGTGTPGTGSNPPTVGGSSGVGVTNIQGEVFFRNPGGDWQPLAQGQSLNGVVSLRTATGAHATLRAPDGTELFITGKGVELDTRTSGAPTVTLTDGLVDVKRKGTKGEAGFTLLTPIATVTDENTQFSVQYDAAGQTTTVTVTEGVVLITPKNGALQSLRLQAGQQVQVFPDRVGAISIAGAAAGSQPADALVGYWHWFDGKRVATHRDGRLTSQSRIDGVNWVGVGPMGWWKLIDARKRLYKFSWKTGSSPLTTNQITLSADHDRLDDPGAQPLATRETPDGTNDPDSAANIDLPASGSSPGTTTSQGGTLPVSTNGGGTVGPADTGTPSTAGSDEKTITIDVAANRAWTPTGVILNPGALVMVQASGTIEASKASDPRGFYHGVPPGGRAQFHPEEPQPLLPALSLLGKIGRDGPVVPVGPFARWYAGGPYGRGELFLGINDDGLDDNSGAWKVRITTFGPGPAQPAQPTTQPAQPTTQPVTQPVTQPTQPPNAAGITIHSRKPVYELNEKIVVEYSVPPGDPMDYIALGTPGDSGEPRSAPIGGKRSGVLTFDALPRGFYEARYVDHHYGDNIIKARTPFSVDIAEAFSGTGGTVGASGTGTSGGNHPLQPPVVNLPVVNPPVIKPHIEVKIEGVSHDATRTLLAGDVLKVTVRGTPGMRATFDLPPLIKGARLFEFDAGEYVATYKVKRGDQVENGRITAYLRGLQGDDFSQAREPVTIGARIQPPVVEPPVVEPPVVEPPVVEPPVIPSTGTTNGSGGAGTGRYHLVRIEADRTYTPPQWLPPLAYESGKKTYGSDQRSFQLGWDFHWPAETKANLNRSMSTLNLTQVPTEVEPGTDATLKASMQGEWNTSGYADGREYGIFLDGAAGKGDWRQSREPPIGTNQGQVDVANTAHVPQAVNGEVVLPVTAVIHFGYDHTGELDLRLIYGTGPAIGGSAKPPAHQGLQLVLEGSTTDTTGVQDLDKWTIDKDGGTATWNSPWGLVTYQFKLPGAIDAAGGAARLDLKVTVNPGTNFAPGMQVGGEVDFDGPRELSVFGQGGETKSDTINTTIRPRGYSEGRRSIDLLLALQDGVYIRYHYRIEN